MVFLLWSEMLDPGADVPLRHGASSHGWKPSQKGLSVRVKFRGQRLGEGQGYGQVGVVMRSDSPFPLREAFKWPSPHPVT